MAKEIIKIPDIGADSAEIIEILVAEGDQISEEQSLLVLETDKASVEVPSPKSGLVTAVKVALGMSVSEGDEIFQIEIASDSTPVSHEEVTESSADIDDVADKAVTPEKVEETPLTKKEAENSVVEASESGDCVSEVWIQAPDIGAESAEVIEVLITAGDEIVEGDSICVVETDKASVEIPAEIAGVVVELSISANSQIKQGDNLALLQVVGVQEVAAKEEPVVTAPQITDSESSVADPPVGESYASKINANSDSTSKTIVEAKTKSSEVYAGPAVRKLARELGVDLTLVVASGDRGRIVKDDVYAYVKSKLSSTSNIVSASEISGIPAIPPTDWSKFGEIEMSAMSKIHRLTAMNMARNWLNVPHVTQFDDADVTELEDYRSYLKSEAKARGIKMTPLAFILKACATALKQHPKMNSSLHENGEQVVQRKYVHIGIAVDTPVGLLVPVIRDVDSKDIWQLAEDVTVLAGKAKEGKLSPAEMQGGCFTISSLGPMGGTGFTPIVSTPQVGILGVSKTDVKSVWDGQQFVPRKLMPLSLSYDHRAVNGVDAGRFMMEVVSVLGSLDRIWNG